jgi:hypothetical protein
LVSSQREILVCYSEIDLMLRQILGVAIIIMGACMATVVPIVVADCVPQIAGERPGTYGIPGQRPDCDEPGTSDGGPPPNPNPDTEPDPDPDLTGPCKADITLQFDDGKAPFTAHVHAIDENEAPSVCLMRARYFWDFDDPGSPYNELEGWNAAHTYDEPGTYKVTLTVVDDWLGTFTDTVTVTVTEDNRDLIHVSNSGDDSNNGRTPSKAVRTMGRVAELLTANDAILFNRGETFHFTSVLVIARNGILVGAYGSGSNPVLTRTDAPLHTPLIAITGNPKKVTVQDIRFTSPDGPGVEAPRGINPSGRSITVRRCQFDGLSFAMNSELGVKGWLTQGNDCDVTGTYYAWNDGTDIVHLDNVMQDSLTEHNVRGKSIERVLLAHNDMVNHGYKTNFWWMEGSHVWVRNNRLDAIQNALGPHEDEQDPDRRILFVRVESNDFVESTLGLKPGAKHVRITNNIFDEPPGTAIDIQGFDPYLERASGKVEIANNTIVSSREHARAVYTTFTDVDGLVLRRNMFVAPNLVTGGYNSASVYLSHRWSTLPDDHLFEDNIWAMPVDRTWCDGVYYAWDYWFACDGYLNEDEWEDLPHTHNEMYRRWRWTDLDQSLNPTFSTDAGARR